jgi:hypothetical protein
MLTGSLLDRGKLVHHRRCTVVVVQCASSTSLVMDVAKVRLGGWEIRRMGSVLCMCFFCFCFFDGL